MRKVILYVLMGIVVSAAFFSISFTFLPKAINSKIIFAGLGVLLFLYDTIKQGEFTLPKEIWGAMIIVSMFCVVGFIAADVNYTADYSYATYFISFFTWLFASYAVCWLIRTLHGKATLNLLVNYLAIVCVVQCLLALGIDKYPALKLFVDRYVDQGQEFFTDVNRLYGVGVALDSAGVRFSMVLIMIPAVIFSTEGDGKIRGYAFLMLLAFFIISVIGNIISRTTILGVIIGLVFLIVKMLTGAEQRSLVFKYFILLLLFFSAVSVFLYKTDKVYEEYFRFAFEGFFNFFERGEWRTGSTDKLNRTMWIWPETTQEWLIGTGLYDNWVYGTDIGYCRLILYNGLIGFSVLVLFFLYQAYVFSCFFSEYVLLFVAFIVLAFLIWIKVSTDIFQIFAFFYFLDNSRGKSLFKMNV